MIPGYNHNVKYKERVYHVQTEDSGLQNPHVITHLFVGGNIVESRKTSYADLVGHASLTDQLVAIMQGQHKGMLKDLINGLLDKKIIERSVNAATLSGPAPLNVEAGAQHRTSFGISGAPAPTPPQPAATTQAPPPAATRINAPAPIAPAPVTPPKQAPGRTPLQAPVPPPRPVQRQPAATAPVRPSPVAVPPPLRPPPPALPTINPPPLKRPTAQPTPNAPVAIARPVPPPAPVAAAPAAPLEPVEVVDADVGEVLEADALARAFESQNEGAVDSIFGEDLISEKSLDEVILSYLADDMQKA